MLSGIRVLDLSRVMSGPYCTALLADLGAEVIKIETPGSGDDSRNFGPFVGEASVYFALLNRTKKSVTLNLKEPRARAILARLAAKCDVVVENFRPGVAARLECDAPRLRAINPRLVYAAISGYGHTGPKAGRGGYDIIAQGESGLMALTGGADDGPIRFPTPMSDITAGIYTVIGILTALLARAQSGIGQFIDVSLVDAQTTWLANIAGSYFATGRRPKKIGNLHPTITPYQPVRTKDKTILIAVGTESLWQRLCKVLGVEETLMRDPRFISNPQRNEHRQQLIPLLEAILATRTADEWLADFVAHEIPAGPINFPDETLNDEHLKARGMVVELEHPLAGLVRSIGNPIHLSETPPTYRRYPPRLGEHNAEIAEWLAAVPAPINEGA